MFAWTWKKQTNQPLISHLFVFLSLSFHNTFASFQLTYCHLQDFEPMEHYETPRG